MVVLYSTDCPRCIVLEKKLAQKNIEFEKNTTFTKREMLLKGFASTHLLEVDGQIMKFEDAVKWVNEQN